MFDVIIAANGGSVRMGFDKLSQNAGSKTILNRCVDCFRGLDGINKIIVVTDIERSLDGVSVVAGGQTRCESVAKGLILCDAEYVLVHDGARPFVSKKLIENVMDTVKAFGTAIPFLPMTDSLRLRSGNILVGSAAREDAVAVQTPQGYKTELLRRAYSAAAGKIAGGKTYTDESEMYTEFIGECRLVEGEANNRKVTVPADLFGMNAHFSSGFDVHRFIKNKQLKLGGVTVSHEFGLMAHSDGDVVLHALMDAILGLCGEKDIGYLFPEEDEQYENVDSRELLKKVLEIARYKNIEITSVNVTVMAQKPKLSSYIDAIRMSIAELMQLTTSAVSVTATTTENLGIIGEEKGIAVLCVIAGV